MSSTNILHVLGTAQVEASAYVRIVEALAKGLNPSRYRLHACFLGPSGPLIEELRHAGVIVQNIDWVSGSRDFIGAWRFLDYLRRHNFAIVHQHRILGETARSLYWLVKAATRARVVVHLHGRLENFTAVEGIPTTVYGADRIIVVSQALALQIGHLSPVVIYNGVPLGREVTAGSGVESQKTVIGTACRLVSSKGLIDLLKAMVLIRAEFPNMQLEIAGSGEQQADLAREVDRLKLTDHVRFLGWQWDLRPALRRWDIFVLPSRNEAFPIAVLEAMSEGLPIVATNVGGLPELIENEHTGFLIPPCEPAALARQLRILMLKPELRRAQGKAGRRRVINHFSVDQMVEQISAIYFALIDP